MPNISKSLIIYFVLANLFSINAAYATDDFPGRTQYPNVEYITVDDLYKKRASVVIVDTRSDYEYNTLRIKNAVNIPVSNIEFSKRIRELADSEKKPIVFYCNGHSCTKSYEAVIKAKRFAKLTDTVAFDAGVTDWALRYPDEAVLLGRSPVDPTKLISSDEFKQHLLKPADFVEKANKHCLIIDVRDGTQRHDHIFAGFEHSVSLDKMQQQLLDKYIDQAVSEKKPLCIYDAVGKQVEWLQYHLKQKNVRDYFFMDGGVKAYEDMRKQQ
ncbi:MAG: hypothetical protein HYZ31_02865 [Gammaproteobacteria bacterium]|nr:hypothetical protein [Gammaproteobacteria bacterium]